MFDRNLTYLSFGQMILGGGSHRPSSSTSGFSGPGARSHTKGPVLHAPPPGLVFSRREVPWRSKCYGTRMPWRTLTPPDPVEFALSLGGRVFEVGRCGWLVGCLMV